MRSKVLGIVIQVVVMIIIVSVVVLLVIGVQILIHACIFGRAFRRGLSTTERGGSEGGGMSPEDLEQLPSFEFQAVEKSSSSTDAIECAVCLESFGMGEKCRMLPVCKHSFHVHCVDSWLVRTPVCPVCRTSCL